MKKLTVQKSASVVPVEIIHNKIYLIRGQKVMLDKDLAELYSVPTGHLNRAVKRNSDRFPEDFMFQLTKDEDDSLRCQIGISNVGRGGKRYLAYVFTEQGVAMLSSVLSSSRAIHVNIQIMRVFTKLREMMISHKDLERKIEDMERKLGDHDKKFVLVFDAIRQLIKAKEEPVKSKEPLGFQLPRTRRD